MKKLVSVETWLRKNFKFVLYMIVWKTKLLGVGFVWLEESPICMARSRICPRVSLRTHGRRLSSMVPEKKFISVMKWVKSMNNSTNNRQITTLHLYSSYRKFTKSLTTLILRNLSNLRIQDTQNLYYPFFSMSNW